MNQWLSGRVCVLAVGVLGIAGCQHCCQRSCPPPCPPPAFAPAPACGPGAAVFPPQPVAPPPNLAPAAVPPQPAPAPVPPQVQNYGPAPAAPPPLPEQPVPVAPATPNAPQEAAKESLPPSTPPPPEAPPARLSPPVPETPQATEGRSGTSAWPVGIPQFAYAREQVASGLKPLPGGFEWLAANGYRSVLHLRRPGEDDSADRQQAEKLGLKFQSLEVSPQTLSRGLLDEFNRIAGDRAGLPLFVYDQNGTLAGGLWYLQFRTVDRLSDEQARAQAARLGFKPEAAGEAGTMWLAIQKLLSEQAR